MLKGKDEALAKLMEEIFNQVLIAQSTEQLGAGSYERTEKGLLTVMSPGINANLKLSH